MITNDSDNPNTCERCPQEPGQDVWMSDVPESTVTAALPRMKKFYLFATIRIVKRMKMAIIDIFKEYSVPFRTGGHHHCTPGFINVDCPHCSPNWNHYRLGWNLSGNYFSCWLCRKVPVAETLALLTKLSVGEAIRLLKEINPDRKIPKDLPPARKLFLPSGREPLSKPHKRYLNRRGFDWKEISSLWRVEGFTIHPRLSWRLFIPIILSGEIVSWTTRSISDEVKSRYISAGIMEESHPRNELLYGEDLAGQAIIIVEGPLDVWKIGPGAVATLGTGYSRAQLLRMTKYPLRVVCYDSERAAQKRARQLCSQLDCFSGETFNVVLDSKDPGEASMEEIQELRHQFLT